MNSPHKNKGLSWEFDQAKALRSMDPSLYIIITIHSTTYIKKQSRRSQSKEWPIDPNRPGSHGHHPRPCPVTLGHTSHLRSSVSRGDFLLFLLCLLLVFLPQIHPLDHTPKHTRNTQEQSLGSNRPIQGLCLSFSLEFSLCFSLCGMSKNRPE